MASSSVPPDGIPPGRRRSTPPNRDNTAAAHQDSTEVHSEPRKRRQDSLFMEYDDEDTLAQVDQLQKRLKAKDDLDFLRDLTLDEAGRVVAYDPNRLGSEDTPNHGSYHETFPETEKLVRKVVDTVIESYKHVRSIGFMSSEIDKICSQAAGKFITVSRNYPGIKRSALLGRSGDGKSSTTNCLFGQRRVAYRSDGGTEEGRGTNVVHEYSRCLQGQLTKYLVTAQYKNDRQVSQFVQRHCHNILNSIAYAAGPEEVEGEKEEAETSCESSIALVYVMLCDRFASKESLREFFESTPQQDAIQEVTEPVLLLKHSRELVDGEELHTAQSPEDLGDIFRRIARVAEDGTHPHPWPIIRLIGIHFWDALLNASFMLGDTPGTNDCNQAVMDATTAYIRDAGLVIIVEHVTRVMNSADVDDICKRLARLQRDKRIKAILVVTGIDSLWEPTDEWKEELGEGAQLLLARADEVVSTLEKRGKELHKLIMGGSTNIADYQENANLPKQIALAEAKRAQMIIEMKTSKMKKPLAERMRKVTNSKVAPLLEVFFVSNTEFRKHMEGYAPEKPPMLGLDATGVPALRQRLYAEPALGKTTALARICDAELPRITQSIIAIMTRSLLDRKDGVRSVLINVMGWRNEIVDALFSRLQDEFKTGVIATMIENQPKFLRKASTLTAELRRVNHSSFLAFCEKNGIHTPRRKKCTNWNVLISDIFAEEVAGAFDRLHEATQSIESELEDNSDEFFTRILTELDENGDFQGVETGMFKHLLSGLRKQLRIDVTAIMDSIRDMFEDLRLDCVTEPVHVQLSMETTYKACREVRKRKTDRGGPDERRKNMLAQKLTGGSGRGRSVFFDVRERMQDDFVALVKVKRTSFETTLETLFKNILDDFDMSFGDANDADVQPSDMPGAKILMDAVHEADVIIRGEMRESVMSWNTQ